MLASLNAAGYEEPQTLMIKHLVQNGVFIEYGYREKKQMQIIQLNQYPK